MILSVSRRTDVPNYYSDWFYKRVEEGYVCVRNPMNAHQISRIEISPEVVDCIVFWTKNPEPMMARLDELRMYSYYFQFTLTGYGKDVEPGLPDKPEHLISVFQELAGRIGKERVIWRYDPILLNNRYTAGYHRKAFAAIAGKLKGYTEKVIISYVDFYAKTKRSMEELHAVSYGQPEMLELSKDLASIAHENGLLIESCAESADLSSAGVSHGSCIDRHLIERLLGCRIEGGKDKNQREECGCFESMEVGTYNTCLNGCRYCYANYSQNKVRENWKRYDVNSPILCGSVGVEDIITERKVKSLKVGQMSMFE